MVMCEWGVCWRRSDWVFVGEGVIGVIAGEGRSVHWIIRYSLACMIRITRDMHCIPW